MRALIVLLILMLPAAAEAGLRATYGRAMRAPLLIEIADNGDMRTELEPGRTLIVRGGEPFLVVDRLTGPLVTRVADLEALAAARPPAQPPAGAPSGRIVVSAAGAEVVNGRTGRAFSFVLPGAGREPTAVAVVSDDPALAPLAAALRHILAAERASHAIMRDPTFDYGEEDAMRRVLSDGAPIRLYDQRLRTAEPATIAPERFALPVEPETRTALSARLAEAMRDDDPGEAEAQMIVRAVSAGGRLWLLTDGGDLSSLADREARRLPEHPGGPVLDICRADGALIAVTGRRGGGRAWTVRRLERGTWRTLRTVARRDDSLVALSCAAAAPMLLSDTRIIDLAGGADVTLSAPPQASALRTVVHVTPDAIFLGYNKGEWGGGAQRIDRRTGRVETIEREGPSCEGPLNTGCNPVNALATVPWRPDCVAAAIGLNHFEPSGRITSICPGAIEQLASVRGDIDPENERQVAEADSGGYGSIAFYGLMPAGDRLLAAGHDGLYRIGPDGVSERRPWPRFVRVDDVLVSFALPDAILVVTRLNQRASVSGGSPLLVQR